MIMVKNVHENLRVEVLVSKAILTKMYIYIYIYPKKLDVA